tara:strand:+ start:1490 stop:2473 length:984 start_codon:yes stop_codon:yes gene_type:complete
MNKKKVIIIDMLNMYVRNFSAFAITNDDGNLVSGIYGSLASIRSQIELHKPDYAIIAWEGENSSERRRKTLKTYKDGRSFKGLNRKHFDYSQEDEKDSFARQLFLLKECLDELPVYQLAVRYLEADDVIGYLCKKVLKDEYEKIIISSDKDYYQLVDETTTIFRPVKTKAHPQGEYVDVDWMSKVENCYPPNHIMLKAIAGCKSDKIDGIAGVGEPTVLKDFPFLSEEKEYDVSSLIEFSQDQSNKKYKKYIDNEELIKKNVKLVQLVDPDISMKSVDTIYKIMEKTKLKFNPPKFRIKLISEGISPSNIDNWVGSFSTLHTKSIAL